jgi:5-methylcytosine-specific restriction enzyme A
MGAVIMNLTEAIVAVLVESGRSMSSREIADSIWDQLEEFRNTPAQLSSKRYSKPIEALRAAVATTVKKSARFSQDHDGSVLLVRLSEAQVPWSDEELRASVEAYLEMRSLAVSQQPFVKKSYYLRLSERFGRTPSAFEFRMQNISAVLASQGRYWIPGLPPAKNVGPRVLNALTAMLAAYEGEAYPSILSPNVTRVENPPTGRKRPESRRSEVTLFSRDADVRAWVLQNANGICEACDMSAPFVGVGGPFLEVHHVRRLADGGSDTVTNALALCPNCHCRLHYAIDSHEVVSSLFKKIARLALDYD